MKTLSTPITNEAAAEQSAWVELYDIYLKSAISTPWGTTAVIRLCNRIGNNFSFFTPEMSPEATGTQGDVATYYPWPLKREVVRSSGQFTDSKLEITGSNVTAEFAALISTIDWYDTPVVIRKTSPNLAGATSLDCAVLFSGLVDAVKVTDKTVTLVCSNDLALLNRILPSENMHASCRFKMFDDQCTLIRFKAENYKAKTVGSSSTTTLVKSAGLTEDSGNSASYGTDIVDALSSGAITTSSEKSVVSFLILPGPPGGTGFPYFSLKRTSFRPEINTALKFTGSAPSPFVVGTTYYVKQYIVSHVITLSATIGGAEINLGGGLAYSYTMQTVDGFEGHRVRASTVINWWAFNTDADWGTVDNAYYVIPDAQAGLKNAELKPYIQFDFGSAKQPKLWRVASVTGGQDEQRLRIIQFFSSPDASTWAFESYFEMPNRGGELFDVLIPGAASARYWRICVRSRWAESLYYDMFYEVRAYELSRHWWRDGLITFDAATATVALRNVKRKVLESYSGELAVQELPVAPANGDTFVIERGCARTFNACCERENTENYGGFNDLPLQTVIR